MLIVELASEAVPFIKTGGLGDVAGALSRALAHRGHEVHLVLPLYASVDRYAMNVRPANLQVPTGLPGSWQPMEVFRAGPEGPGLPNVWMLSHPLFDRPGLYGDGRGDYPDNHVRFAAYSRGALELIRQRIPKPDVLHLHDWQAAIPAIDLRTGGDHDPLRSTRIVFTIHNLAYTGSFPADGLDDIGISRKLYAADGLEFHGRVALIKGGLIYADELTTVSPRYAREVQTPEYGSGLDGLLRSRADHFSGILNGIDEQEWNPATDHAIAARYDVEQLGSKAVCKADLQRDLGLRVDPRAPLLAVVSRLTWQKGLDLIAELADSICERGGQLAVLGTGDPELEQRFIDIARRREGQCATRIRFDDSMAHRFIAGADMFLMPSRYEPCGLTQMYALRYGTVPIVRSVGGLDDTVAELDSARGEGTGFKFGAASSSALWATILRAMEQYKFPAVWAHLQARGMIQDFSWDASASAYEALFFPE